MIEQSSWLMGFLHQTKDEARRRGDREVAAEHIALALARPSEAIDGLFATLGIDPLDWRDQIITVLRWREGGRAAREGRPAGAVADSAEDLRFRGDLETHAVVRHIVHLAQSEAAANDEDIGAAHVLVALLLEGESVGAATGRWLGMTPGRVRSAAGLRNTRRLIADGAPATRAPSSEAAGPMLLCSGGTDADLLAQVVDLASQHAGGGRPEVVLVDLGWHTLRPTPNSREGCESLRLSYDVQEDRQRYAGRIGVLPPAGPAS
jgi:ATP-dependent Clp protease ATP-binding subunit ClpA